MHSLLPIHEYFGRYTYLFLDAISIIFPLLLSFDRKVHFYTYWWRLIPAMLTGAGVFLIWDEWFTKESIWSFNQDYIIGFYLGHLPLEEWLFFLCIPFSCIFIYECLKAYFPDLRLNSKVITFMLIALFLMIGIPNYHRLYTSITFTGAGIMLLVHYLIFKDKWLSHFYVMWLIHLLPLFLINGFLTSIPVVLYDDFQNLGIRITTVPLEDSFYSMLLLLINITVYEWLAKFKRKRT